MFKIIIPMLLAMLLFACSANQTVYSPPGGDCKPINLSNHVPSFRQLNAELLDNLNHNLPEYRKTILDPVPDIDQHRKELRFVLDTEGFLNPDTDLIKHLISEELFGYNKSLSALDLTEIKKEIKNYIPDYDKHRCPYALHQDYSQLCK